MTVSADVRLALRMFPAASQTIDKRDQTEVKAVV